MAFGAQQAAPGFGLFGSRGSNPHFIPIATSSSSTINSQKSPNGEKFASPSPCRHRPNFYFSVLTGPVVLSLLFASCGKPKPAPSSAAHPSSAPKVSDAKVEAEMFQTMAEPQPESSADPVDEKVADIRSRYPGKNAKELLETPEVKAKLGEVLKELSQRKDLQDKLNSTVAAAASFKGLDPTPGRHAFKLDVTGYSDARTDHMLRAVMSGRAANVVDFLVGEVGEATPELTLGGVEKSANGISIDAVTPPPKP
jgi:hypothetical protein